jgi:hypothetical protein
VRGVDFSGSDFDAFEPMTPDNSHELAKFHLHHKTLCSCIIECEIPIPVVKGSEVADGTLHMRLILGNPASNGGLDREVLELELRYKHLSVSSGGKTGWFEDELLQLQARLPKDTYMKACANCGLSDYHPAGHGLYGGLACFRDNKVGYRAVRGRHDIINVWDTMTEFVQETYLCPEFERRKPGTGYRG